MKRSEMVKKINSALVDLHLVKGDAIGVCQYILKKIEDAGMLPPDIPRSNYNGDNSPTINEWEPEDE